MAGNVDKVTSLLKKAAAGWKTVQRIYKPAKKIGDVAQIVLKITGGTSEPWKYAKDDLKQCVQLGLAIRLYTKPFEGKEATFFMEEYTDSSAGRKGANSQAVRDIQALKFFLNSLGAMASSCKSLTKVIAIEAVTSLKETAEGLTATPGGNAFAVKKATTDFEASIKAVKKATPALDAAIDMVQRLPK